MNKANKECILRQFQEEPEQTPANMARLFSAFPAGEPKTAAEAAEILTTLEAPACTVDGCTISLQGLLGYITNSGGNAPRQALDEAVAPSCTLLDIPHEAEEALGPYLYHNDPRSQE